MYLMIDNYDSFVYNLISYIEELDRKIEVIRNDHIDFKLINNRISEGKLDGIIISPGPKNPKDCGASGKIIKEYKGKIPILGVCLGHQIIAHEFGGTVEKGAKPMHGKITGITHNNTGIFQGLPQNYRVTRYHSLAVIENSLPETLQVDAIAEDGAIMGISHKIHPIYGVQFHPEAVLTENGHSLIENFLLICEGNRWKNENVS